MDKENNQYHTSFFRPSTDSARRNRNIVVQFVLIWAVAIFGFQIALRVLEKPVPEEAYTIYEENWDNLTAAYPEVASMQSVGRSALSVLGKVAIDPVHREALDNGLSWMAYSICDSAQKVRLTETVSKFEEVAATTEDIHQEKYLASKMELISILSEIFDLPPNDVRSKIAPLEVHASMMEAFGEESRKTFKEAMSLYLIHNRSVLTDTEFLGFPFHYFYTAVFLLVLFVGLCWLYCVRTDMFNKKYGIAE
jgi:putative solute:sodium symporter small subunit